MTVTAIGLTHGYQVGTRDFCVGSADSQTAISINDSVVGNRQLIPSTERHITTPEGLQLLGYRSTGNGNRVRSPIENRIVDRGRYTNRRPVVGVVPGCAIARSGPGRLGHGIAWNKKNHHQTANGLGG